VFAARRAKELGADAIIVLNYGTEYLAPGFTSGLISMGWFQHDHHRNRTFGSLFFGKADTRAEI